MKKITLLTFIAAFLLVSASFAETTINAEVDKTKVSTDTGLTYKVTISSSESQIPAPQFPKFEGFKVISHGQSSAMSFRKGALHASLQYVFILAPLKEGKIKIEPTQVKIQNKSFSSQAFEIEVAQGKTKPQTPPKPPSSPKAGQPQSQEPQVTL